MKCTNCGNLVAPSEEMCATCGTVNPAVSDAPEVFEVGNQITVSRGPASARGLLIGVAVAIVVVVGGLSAVLLTGGESTEVVEESSEAPGIDASEASPTTLPVPTTVASTSPASDSWRPAAVEGSLSPFENPDLDTAPGSVAPAIAGFDFSGSAVAIEDNGKPKLIVFLAHWCPHCQREVPSVQAFLDEVGVPDGVEFISVVTAIDETRPNYPPDGWLADEGWTPSVIVDPDQAVADAYGLSAFPFYVFIREDFTIDFRISGELDPEPVFAYTETLFGPAPDRSPTVSGPSNYDQAITQPTACGGTAPASPEIMSFTEPGDGPTAESMTFVTSCGEIRVDLDPEAAPATVNSMLFLAEEGYFDGTICHRLVPAFVLQCGDPTGTGTGSPGYVVADEFPESSDIYVQGVVAMANAGPGTTGSQFFVILGDATFLPPQFTVIGTIADVAPLIAGLDGVARGMSANGEASAPLETIYIESVTLGN